MERGGSADGRGVSKAPLGPAPILPTTGTIAQLDVYRGAAEAPWMRLRMIIALALVCAA